jgi:hypothetical protein
MKLTELLKRSFLDRIYKINRIFEADFLYGNYRTEG